ncbi:MAG: c-type cytochrome [Gammaproteobacteria bacterium]|nr:c-type cytochrome [Gammaproteobacteria bacterium]
MRNRCLTLVLALGASLPAQAVDYSTTPDQFVYCTVCHGVELKGNKSVDAPKLNGLEQWYVLGQLQAFRSGRRGTHDQDLVGQEMRPMAAVLTDEQLQQAAVYVTSIPTLRAEATLDGDARRGETLYQSCVLCHGPQAQGDEALHAPQLAGQSDWYLVRQLEKYQSGIRGSAPGDTWGAQMRASALALSDKQSMIDVIAYINTLQDRK